MSATDPSPGRLRTSLLALGALGVVFGDIGTSPLYAFQAAIATGVGTGRDEVIGLLSLFLWALIIVVSIKYLMLVMRVSNRGEGGALALSALARRKLTGRTQRWAFLAGLVGVGLFYADGAITPAVSVLSAAEGVEVSFPSAAEAVLPIALVVITLLFVVQRFGTGKVGAIFGPLMIVWFVTIGVLGLREVIVEPAVLAAFNPIAGLAFIGQHPGHALAVLGAVVLCITGVETLYADMGHFGRTPIIMAWLLVAMPGVMLAYLGQGALVLTDPTAASNPFFNLGPGEMAIPLLILATVATFIASQAVISGVFSMTRQAIQLDLIPRERVVHTSESVEGQIYMPFPTWTLYAFVVILVLTFGTSSALAGAYGFAVTATMLITTVLTLIVARNAWGWSPVAVTLAFAPLLLIDIVLFAAVSEKLPHGGWVSLAVALALLAIMITWRRGRVLVRRRIAGDSRPIEDLPAMIPAGGTRIPGIAVFMAASTKVVPHALAVHLRHNKLFHERLVLVTLLYRDTPHVDPAARVLTRRVADDIQAFEMWYGFMERPDVPNDLAEAWAMVGLPGTPREAMYVVSDDALVVTKMRVGMPRWQKRLFAVMHRNSERSADYFRLPAGQVIHLGTEVEI